MAIKMVVYCAPLIMELTQLSGHQLILLNSKENQSQKKNSKIF